MLSTGAETVHGVRPVRVDEREAFMPRWLVLSGVPRLFEQVSWHLELSGM